VGPHIDLQSVLALFKNEVRWCVTTNITNVAASVHPISQNQPMIVSLILVFHLATQNCRSCLIFRCPTSRAYLTLMISWQVGLKGAWEEVTAFVDALVRFARPHTIIGTVRHLGPFAC
jgi:hypothetical protein